MSNDVFVPQCKYCGEKIYHTPFVDFTSRASIPVAWECGYVAKEVEAIVDSGVFCNEKCLISYLEQKKEDE
mgnify:CR=1 FL=1